MDDTPTQHTGITPNKPRQTIDGTITLTSLSDVVTQHRGPPLIDTLPMAHSLAIALGICRGENRDNTTTFLAALVRRTILMHTLLLILKTSSAVNHGVELFLPVICIRAQVSRYTLRKDSISKDAVACTCRQNGTAPSARGCWRCFDKYSQPHNRTSADSTTSKVSVVSASNTIMFHSWCSA